MKRKCLPAPLSSVCGAEFLPPLSFDASPEDSTLCSYSSSSCSCLSLDSPSFLKRQSKCRQFRPRLVCQLSDNHWSQSRGNLICREANMLTSNNR